MNQQRLSDKVAVVSGTGPNIGQEIAKTLAAHGAKVMCTDVDAEDAQRTAAAIQAAGGEALACRVDIRDPQQIQQAIDHTLAAFGRIDILVNNAAITVNKGTLAISLQEWLDCLQVNLTGTFLFSQLVAKTMVERQIAGCIVNMASTSGHRGRPNAVAYCSSKGGILNMTRAMAMDLAKYGIRVNSVSPTRTGTPVGVTELKTERTAPEIPLGRTGQPRDQALAVLYLVSDEAAFVTGFDLRVDGGALATWGVQEYREVDGIERER
ncbi:MAG: SDR family oxidoreductase [Alicyclobacillus sp.]|nr:SDR family oxidoreductase [Alicyclobacillus sp.]